jgi:hypothetical protein
MQISTGNTSTLLQTVRAGVLQKKQPSMRWWSATLLAFSGRIREKTGIKLPRLCPLGHGQMTSMKIHGAERRIVL